MSDDTRFEEQKRLARSEVLAQMRETVSLQAGPLTLEVAGSPTAVLNEQRQLVYANRAFRELTGAASVEELCGQRPGEILACLHAGNGCGESESCLFCGAGQAIAETLRTRQAATRECHITVRPSDRGHAQDLLVRTTLSKSGAGPLRSSAFPTSATRSGARPCRGFSSMTS